MPVTSVLKSLVGGRLERAKDRGGGRLAEEAGSMKGLTGTPGA